MGAGRPGVNHTAEYQASAIPWVTSSLSVTNARSIEFPSVTRFVKVSNTGTGSIFVGFTQSGVQGKKSFRVLQGATEHFEIRIRDLWLSGSHASGAVDVFGGLTAISRDLYNPITGTSPPPEGYWYVPGVE